MKNLFTFIVLVAPCFTFAASFELKITYSNSAPKTIELSKKVQSVPIESSGWECVTSDVKASSTAEFMSVQCRRKKDLKVRAAISVGCGSKMGQQIAALNLWDGEEPQVLTLTCTP